MIKSVSFAILGLLFMGWQPLIAQNQQCTISGYVNEEGSAEQLAGAHVYTEDLEHGSVTNTYGFFSLTLPCRSDTTKVTVVASFVGYEQQKLTVDPHIKDLITFQLAPVMDMDEVEVVADRLERIDRSTQMSVTSVPVDRIANTPTLLGEADVLKTLQLLPGVQGGAEGTSGMHVRGGTPDQNLILLDGVPVYNAYHLFGLFSVFNSDAVKRVQLSKGGFPARYGGRLSSVVEVDMKEGNMKEYHGKGSIGLVASRFTFEGPIIEDKASFIFSARRTYIDLLAKPFINKENTSDYKFDVGYYFMDLTGKVNYKFNNRNRVYLSAYFGRDKFHTNEEDTYSDESYKMNTELGWGNITSTLRWNVILSDKLFSNVTLAHSNYNFKMGNYEYGAYGYNPNTDTDPVETEINYLSGVKETRGRWDLDYSPNSNHRVRMGVEGIYNEFSPEVLTYENRSSNYAADTTLGEQHNESTQTVSSWIEDDWDITSNISVNAGLRYTAFKSGDKLFHEWQPRLAARYQFLDNWSAKASYAHTQQNVHLLTSSSFNLPTDLWLPSTEAAPPERARQLAGGVAGVILDQKYQVEIEGYYKWYDNLIEYREGVQFTNIATNWEKKVETEGEGWAYGIEFLIRKRRGRLSGWLAYSLSWSERQFDEINYGKVFPFKYDRRNDLKLTGSYRINDSIEASASWVFHSGAPMTMALASYNSVRTDGSTPSNYSHMFYGNGIDYYGERNSVRMPSYHRLDIAFNFTKEKENGVRTWTLGVLNAYNRKNPFYMYPDSDNGKPVVKQVSILPFMPMITYKFDF